MSQMVALVSLVARRVLTFLTSAVAPMLAFCNDGDNLPPSAERKIAFQNEPVRDDG
jgi:hypothetical protein